jgi:hypothetical protein
LFNFNYCVEKNNTCTSFTSDMTAHIVLLYKNSRLFRLRYSNPPMTVKSATRAIVAE